jgi:hypothetical protein
MTTAAKTQTRGHCQRCGRQQAVRGSMSQHGYTVQGGWFQGVCTGHHDQPIEMSRVEADRMIAEVLADAVRLDCTVADLQAGRTHPAAIEDGNKLIEGEWVTQYIPWDEAKPYQQIRARDGEIFRCESRARSARSFAQQMTSICDTFPGKPLTVVTLAPAAPRIEAGERRQSSGGSVLTATYQDGGRVNWKRLNSNGSTSSGWTGSKAWRTFTLVA